MKITYRRRQSGKTTEMIKWVLARRDRILIVMNEHRINHLEREHDTLKGRGQLMTLRTYMQHSGAMGRSTQVSIDDAEMVLSNFLRHPIQNMTLSNSK